MISSNDAEYYVNANPIPFPGTLEALDSVRKDAFNAGLDLRKFEDDADHRFRRNELRKLREQMVCDLMVKQTIEQGSGSPTSRIYWFQQIEEVVDQTMEYLVATGDKRHGY